MTLPTVLTVFLKLKEEAGFLGAALKALAEEENNRAEFLNMMTSAQLKGIDWNDTVRGKEKTSTEKKKKTVEASFIRTICFLDAAARVRQLRSGFNPPAGKPDTNRSGTARSSIYALKSGAPAPKEKKKKRLELSALTALLAPRVSVLPISPHPATPNEKTESPEVIARNPASGNEPLG